MVCLFSEFFFCVGYLLLFVFKDGRESLGRQPWLAGLAASFFILLDQELRSF